MELNARTDPENRAAIVITYLLVEILKLRCSLTSRKPWTTTQLGKRVADALLGPIELKVLPPHAVITANRCAIVVSYILYSPNNSILQD